MRKHCALPHINPSNPA